LAGAPSIESIPEIDVSWMESLPTPNAQIASVGVTKNVPRYALPGTEGGPHSSRIVVAAESLDATKTPAIAKAISRRIGGISTHPSLNGLHDSHNDQLKASRSAGVMIAAGRVGGKITDGSAIRATVAS